MSSTGTQIHVFADDNILIFLFLCERQKIIEAYFELFVAIY